MDASFGTTPLAMQQAIRLMERNLVDPAKIVSHRFALKDIHEAVKCYEMAFERGKLTVGEELERMYKEGREGLPKDPEKAASWRQRYVEAYNRP